MGDKSAENIIRGITVSYTHLDVYKRQDVDVATVINAAKRYPMMSEHQVVIVKEAQAIRLSLIHISGTL